MMWVVPVDVYFISQIIIYVDIETTKIKSLDFPIFIGVFHKNSIDSPDKKMCKA